MENLVYKNFSFITKGNDGDGYYRPVSIDVAIEFECDGDPIEKKLILTNMIDSLNGSLIISEKDEQFEYMMSIYRNNIFDCVAIATLPELITIDNFDWLVTEFKNYLQTENTVSIKHLFIYNT